ncbi:uncharacterized protein METZ01_LOCUS326446, partial [marine metagenome]
FGLGQDEALDIDAVRRAFAKLADRVESETGDSRTPMEVADGFLRIAVENMANAIKKVSVQRGYDVTGYTLNCFGGAGGQHACLVADALGMGRVFIHPFAGVLSAYGMGLADVRALKEKALELPLGVQSVQALSAILDELVSFSTEELAGQGIEPGAVSVIRRVHLRYEGTDTALQVDYGSIKEMQDRFELAYRQRYGFVMPDKGMVIEAAAVEAVGKMDDVDLPPVDQEETIGAAQPQTHVSTYMAGEDRSTGVFDRDLLRPGHEVPGPAIIREQTATTVVEPGWQAGIDTAGNLIMARVVPLKRESAIGTECDPVMLEVFNNLFMSIAEQMGLTLENTAYSV